MVLLAPGLLSTDWAGIQIWKGPITSQAGSNELRKPIDSPLLDVDTLLTLVVPSRLTGTKSRVAVMMISDYCYCDLFSFPITGLRF